MQKRVKRTIELIVADIVIIFGTLWLAMKILNEVNIIKDIKYLPIILSFILVKVVVYYILKLYHLLLDYVGFNEVIKIIIAVLLTNSFLLLLFPILLSERYVYQYVLMVGPLESLLMLTTRFSKRFMNAFGMTENSTIRGKYVRTLIIGAGSAGKLALDVISQNASLKNKVVAFVDDNEDKQNTRISGIPVIGPIANISDMVAKYQVQEVIIAISNISKLRLKEIIEIIAQTSIKVKRLPLTMEEGLEEPTRFFDVKIEDLLNRGVIQLDNAGLSHFLKSKSILVTGGGGSIGGELCGQILSYDPKYLILFDIYENTTYEVQIELMRRIKQEKRNTELIVLIGSVYNKERLENVFKTYQPQIVFHAAAYKHVPLMEDSAVEAIRTNVLGTYNVARCAHEYKLEKMILVSTDKAVRPTNIMGATKSVCEKIIQYFDSISETKYAAVRFGNVLGSHGSVVPLFQKQIADGGPITITHPEITRFFMTIPEAVSLILQSGVYAESGEIFILDMGEPVKIASLADKMIRLAGLTPNKDIMIEFVGLRPGEKLYEELLVDTTKNQKTANDKIYIEEKQNICDIEGFIELVKKNLDSASNDNMKELVHSLVSTYVIQNNNH